MAFLIDGLYRPPPAKRQPAVSRAVRIVSQPRPPSEDGRAVRGYRSTSDDRRAMEIGRNFDNYRPQVVTPAPSYRSGVVGSGGAGSAAGGGAGVGPGAGAAGLSNFQMDEINAALAAISARYDYEGQGLRNQQGALERAFELLRSNLDEDRDRALFESKARSGGSGRIRSGLFLQDQARISDEFADQLVRARAAKTAQVAPIIQALGSLEARRDAERAASARTIAREMVGSKEAIAAALELV